MLVSTTGGRSSANGAVAAYMHPEMTSVFSESYISAGQQHLVPELVCQLTCSTSSSNASL